MRTRISLTFTYEHGENGPVTVEIDDVRCLVNRRDEQTSVENQTGKRQFFDTAGMSDIRLTVHTR